MNTRSCLAEQINNINHKRNNSMKHSINHRSLLTVTGAVALALTLVAPARAADWPQWRGPDRNGISSEKIAWPAGGPKQLWKASVGQGYSAVTVSEGRAYTMGCIVSAPEGEKKKGPIDGVDTVWCFDAKTGAVIWKYSYPYHPVITHGKYPAPYTTPVVGGSLVYALCGDGRLFALDAAKGTVVWTVNYFKDLVGHARPSGCVSSPLVDGNLLIVNPGGEGTSVVALDKASGKVVWKSGSDRPAHSSLVPFQVGPTRAVAVLSFHNLTAYGLADGRELWNTKWETMAGQNAADPIIAGDRAFITSGHGMGCALLKFTGDKVETVYTNKQFACEFQSPVLVGECLYGFPGPWAGAKLTCLDLATGAVKWTEKEIQGSVIATADNKLLILSTDGKLILADVSPSGYKELGSASILASPSWTPPTLANSLVYCRNTAGDLVCLDFTGK